jgi:cytoplasmic tRNA 2-thiolation protein 1
MAPKQCALCHVQRAMLKRPKTGQQICRDCFFLVFETEVHRTILDAQLFKRGDKVAIGASGGKGKFTIRFCCSLSFIRVVALECAYADEAWPG